VQIPPSLHPERGGEPKGQPAGGFAVAEGRYNGTPTLRVGLSHCRHPIPPKETRCDGNPEKLFTILLYFSEPFRSLSSRLLFRKVRNLPKTLELPEVYPNVPELGSENGGDCALKGRPSDDRQEPIKRLEAKIAQITMDNELLREKIVRMKDGRPLGRRRPRR